jgi:F0F1-type ATP synthase membrane subunit c/vacuolar-type H+-ATPase subunit K
MIPVTKLIAKFKKSSLSSKLFLLTALFETIALNLLVGIILSRIGTL